MPALYSQMPRPILLVGFGWLSSHRLCSSAAAIGLIAVTTQTNGWAVPLLFKKKRLQYWEKNEFSPSVLRRSTHSVSQGTKVTLVTEYVIFIVIVLGVNGL